MRDLTRVTVVAVLCALALTCTACATPHPVAVTPYQRTQYECQRDASLSHYGGLMELAFYRECMRAHGWSK